MTTRTLLITIPGDILDDRNACGDCPFIAFDWRAGAPEPGRMVCIMPGWEETDIGAGQRHAACLDAERPAPPDRSRLREVHEHISAHVLPALERMDEEGDNV